MPRSLGGILAVVASFAACALPARAFGQDVVDPYEDPPARGLEQLDELKPIGSPQAQAPQSADDDVVPLDATTTPVVPPLGAPAGLPLPSSHAGDPDDGPQRVRVRYALEGIEIRGNARTADRTVLRYVKFRAGDVLDVDDPEIELTKYRLLGTGFFASVQLSLRKGSRRGAAVLVIEVVERNTFVVQNLWLGIAADEDTAGNSEPLSAYLGVEAAETNLAGTGITLGAGIGLAADQLSLRTHFTDPAFAGTRWSVHASLLYIDARDFFGNRDVAFESPLLEQREVTDYAVVAYKRFGGAVGARHDLSVSSDFALEYRLEQIDATVPIAASHVRGDSESGAGVREPIDFDIEPGKSVLAAVRGAVGWDSRDAPFLTRKGTRAFAALTVGAAPLGSAYNFSKVELSAQRWWTLPWRHVVRTELYLGGIAGDAPFFEKFYVGDFTALLPGRVLGLAPDRRQPPNFLGTDIVEVRYGDFAAKLEGEYRVPLYTGKGSVYGVDVFSTLGIYGVATRRELSDPPPGYEGFSRIPIDLSFNLGLRIDTSLGGVTLGFSNLLGLIPSRRGERK